MVRSRSLSLLKDSIPESWKKYTSLMREIDPDAILGGGALRDLHCNREIKDIDFFCNYKYWEEIDSMLIKNGVNPDMVASRSGETMDESAACDESVSRVMSYNNGKIQLIVCSGSVDPHTRFKQFDFGFCQIAWNGSAIITTDAYLHDVECSQITLKRCSNRGQFIDSMYRYKRLRKKYDWPLIIEPNLYINLD